MLALMLHVFILLYSDAIYIGREITRSRKVSDFSLYYGDYPGEPRQPQVDKSLQLRSVLIYTCGKHPKFS